MAHNRKIRKLVAGLLAGVGLMLAALWAMGGSMMVSAAGPIIVNTTADELNGDGDCSLREAIQAANTDAIIDACAAGSGADVITFSLATPAVITLTLGELTISVDPLTIDGPGATQLEVTANDAGRVFNITSDVLVTISGLKAEHGNTPGDGGGLLSVGDVILADAIFEENRSGDDGGAINVQGQLTMTNTDVLSNTSAGFGGGINTLLNPVRLTGGRIENNAAGSWAGGLYANGPLLISGTHFISNSAHSYSGAIFAWQVMTATNARFERNTATTLDVGGVFVFKNATLTNTDFISNTAAQRTGALFVRGDARIVGGTFAGNEAQSGTAGALNVDGALSIDGTQFVANRATGDGGALWYALDSLRIANATFAQNHTDGNGGAVEVRLPLVMTNTNFLTNTAAGQGGAVNASGASVRLTGGTVAANYAGLAGGLYADGVLTVSGTHFISNSAQLFGGAILAWQDVTATNARFERNAAQSFNVGALYVAGNLALTDTDFVSNTAAQNYGAAWVGGSAVMTGGTVSGNVAQSSGAGGFKVDGDFSATGAQLANNRAASAAGALDVRGSLTLTNTDVLSNVAGGDGGGINSFGPSVRISDGEISYNTGGGAGGGLRADGPITVTRTVFDGNTGDTGAAVDVDNSGWFSGTVFSGNTAPASAGGLHATGSLWLTNSFFISNTAAAGAGGSVSAGQDVAIDNAYFWGNSATGNGGGLNASGAVTAIGADFVDNVSGDKGGGLYADGAVSLNDTSFIGNSARTFGGGLFSWQSVDDWDGLFNFNTATDFSVGAVYANGDLDLVGSSFYSNTSGLRDGAVWAGGDATVSGAWFESNRARGGRAGGLDVGGSLWMTQTAFLSNTAATDGGGLVVDGSLWMTGTVFATNTAQSDGGGLALLGNDARLVNVGFWGNGAGGQGGAMALKHGGAVDVFHTSIDGPVTPGSSAVLVNASGAAAFTDTIFSGYATGINLAAGSAREDYNLFNQSASVSGSVTRGGHSVSGNPMFGPGLSLTAGSWAINAGVETRFTTDIDDDTRPTGGAVDIGWDETAFTSDAAIAKTVFVTPFPSPGQAITYTLTFSNEGQSALYGLVITDEIPASITGTTFVAAGAIVTDTGFSPAYVWQVSNLAMGGRGVITVSGIMANPLAWGPFTNTAVITTTSPDAKPANNTSDVTVLVVNAPPVAVPDVFTTAEDTPIGLTPLLNDVDDNPLLVASVSAPAHGMAVISGTATVVYTPTLDFNGVDSFSYIVSDTDLTDTTTITVHVTPVNDAPVAVDDQPAGLEDTPLSIAPLANDTDVDGDSLALTALGAPAHGAAVISGAQTIVYTPALHFNGIDVFSYTVSDGALTDTATISVTIGPANDVPVAADDSATTPEDTPVTITPLGNDTDVDGDALFITSLTGPLHGTIALPGSGSFGSLGTAILSGTQSILYTPAPDFFGLDSLRYIVSDGALTDTATISITVTPVNDAPVAVGDTHMQLENTTGTIAPLGNDTDVDGDSLFISAVDAPAHGTAVISGGTRVLYTPDTNFFGAESFRYTVSDGALTDTAGITVTVAQTIWFNYLPLALSRYSYAPDLVVSNLIAAENAVTVTIKNIGVAPVTGGFWVDVYIAPSPVPTQVNQIWPDVAAQGLVWGVDGDALAQLTPGGSLTLTIGDGLFNATESHFSGGLLSGTPVYAQVDSVNLATGYGGVLETHEITGGLYNNITGVLAGSGSGTFPPPTVGLGREPGHLPAR